ncbi:hypothetical protein SCE1572_16990 [Sorangium cellulosum So0157-2]|uniref:Uncharacterized protein n=1 Tax=Sorangium cellulosum So0157-2 TaxID=1254432 RepID=S4XVX4_SORCE|nr:hypothetical protein SCE1572_16990 [Sorangium cellulosum So0157-2]
MVATSPRATPERAKSGEVAIQYRSYVDCVIGVRP